MDYIFPTEEPTKPQKLELRRLQLLMIAASGIGVPVTLAGAVIFQKWVSHLANFSQYALWIPVWIILLAVGCSILGFAARCQERLLALKSNPRMKGLASMRYDHDLTGTNGRQLLIDMSAFDWNGIDSARTMPINSLKQNKSIIKYFSGQTFSPELLPTVVTTQNFPEQEIFLVLSADRRRVVAVETPAGYLFNPQGYPSLQRKNAAKADFPRLE
jgi:hypothetical protein